MSDKSNVVDRIDDQLKKVILDPWAAPDDALDALQELLSRKSFPSTYRVKENRAELGSYLETCCHLSRESDRYRDLMERCRIQGSE